MDQDIQDTEHDGSMPLSESEIASGSHLGCLHIKLVSLDKV